MVGLGLLVATVLGGVLIGRDRARRDLDDSLSVEVEIRVTALSDFVRRSQDVTLLLGQNSAFGDFYDLPAAREVTIAEDATTMEDVHSALRFVETLYDGQLAEVCFIDRSGAENARIVHGVAASPALLSTDERRNGFFAPSLALPVGETYLSSPYQSPDTGDWVLSQSTPIADATGEVRGLVHFELTIESLRTQVTGHPGHSEVIVVNADSGRVVMDSALPQAAGAPLGRQADHRFDALVAAGRAQGVMSLGRERIAFRRLSTGPNEGNAWYIVVGETSVGGWYGQWSPLQFLLSAIAALLAVLWIWAMWMNARRFQRAAETDALTGLPNRTFLHRAIVQAFEDRDDDRISAVMMLDLDRFKEVNDTLGHHQGDALLRVVSQRLRNCVRPDDVVARLGGDEFGVLLGEIDSAEGASVVARRIRAELDKPFGLGDVTVQIGGSVGIALVPAHGEDVHTVLQRADMAMYDAKTSGRGWALYHADRDPYGENHLGFVNELRTAIDSGGLEIHYQPIIELVSGDVRSVEALVRWPHPQRGMLGPEVFVPIAERAGLIRNLTTAVVRQAIADAGRWHAAGADIAVAINLAGVSLRDTAVVEEIAQLLDDVERPLIRVIVEITESAMLIERDRARECLDRLREIGVRVALDDFGTGYASFVHLKELAVDVLKIDRQFIGAMEHSEIDEVIVRSTIALGTSLRMDVVAEGIEDPRTLEVLIGWGCTMGQGYLIARPLPIEALLDWLASSDRTYQRVSLGAPSSG